jgi:hypothetical protein
LIDQAMSIRSRNHTVRTWPSAIQCCSTKGRKEEPLLEKRRQHPKQDEMDMDVRVPSLHPRLLAFSLPPHSTQSLRDLAERNSTTTKNTQLETESMSRYLDLRTNEPTDPLNPSCLPLPPPTTVDASAGRKLLPNDDMVPPYPPLLDKDQSLSRTRTPHAVASLPFLFIDARSRSPFVQILKLAARFFNSRYFLLFVK